MLLVSEHKLMRLMDYAKIKDSATYVKILNSPEVLFIYHVDKKNPKTKKSNKK